MKKILLAVIILLSAFNIFSSASFGYSLAPVGAMTPTGNYGALTISAIFSPYKETHIGDMELAIDLSPVYPFFESARARIQSPVFMLLHHPFSWMFHNSVIWSPIRISSMSSSPHTLSIPSLQTSGAGGCIS